MATSKYWVKLYNETITDWKFMSLPDKSRLLFYDCLCMAGELDRDGLLPPLSGMSFILRKPTVDIVEAITPLIKAGMVLEAMTIQGDGHYLLSNFSKRQAKMEDKERMRRMREEKKRQEYQDATYQVNTRYEPVTIRNTEEEEEIEIEVDTKFQHLISSFCKASGLIAGNSISWVDPINDYIKAGYTPDDIERAVKFNFDNGYKVTSPKSIQTTISNKQQPAKKKRRLFDEDKKVWVEV